MKDMDGIKDSDEALRLKEEILRQAHSMGRTVTLLEVCGGHAYAMDRLRAGKVLPESIRMISGPGCPVCAVSGSDVDTAVLLAGKKNVVFTASGDMLGVPSSSGVSLQELRKQGSDVRAVSSALDALDAARENPRREVIYMGAGFEDAAASAAALVRACLEQKVRNLSVFSSYKSILPSIEALLDDPGLAVDGVLCPWHVGAVIGLQGYAAVAQKGRAAVVTGRGYEDILESISMILGQIAEGRHAVEIQSAGAIPQEGDPATRDLLGEVFTRAPAEWRGLGVIAGSGFVFRDSYASFNTLARFDVPIMEHSDIMGCMCGSILRGTATPPECPLFGHACNTANPIGPGMVSREGACLSWYSCP